MNIAAQLKLGNRGDARDWAALDALDDRIGPGALAEIDRRGLLGLYATTGHPDLSQAGLEKRRRFLAWELMLWLELSRPTLTVQPTADSWRMEVSYNGCLLAAVALQLTLTIVGARRLFTCSGCGMAYIRPRAAKNGQANFCSQCGRPEALRQADHRRRRKIEQARQLHAAGWSLARIAQELNVRNTARSEAIVTVRRWVDIRG